MKRKNPHHLLAIASAGVCAVVLLARTLGIATGGVPAGEAAVAAVASVPTQTIVAAVATYAGVGIVTVPPAPSSPTPDPLNPPDALAYTAASVILAAVGPLDDVPIRLEDAEAAAEPTRASSTAVPPATATMAAPTVDAPPAAPRIVTPAVPALKPTVAVTLAAVLTRRPSATPTQPVTRPVVPADGGVLNGLAVERINVVPEEVLANVGAIYAQGQALGRNPRAFAKVGDSTMVYPPLLAPFDQRSAYNLGPFSGAQPAIDRFAGSFGRASVAVRKGMHTWSQFDPTWADSAQCRSGEGPLACELRLQNPSIAIIRLGANDAPEPGLFEENLRRIVQSCLDAGVVPVLGTKPDRLEGPSNAINRIVYRLAQEYRVPLWDYDLIAGTVAGKGLDRDLVHFLGGGPHDYSVRTAYAHADSLEDLTALLMLDVLSRRMPLP